MKIFKFLSHPYTLIFAFLFILISGQHLGGFYALYILLGLMHGVLHAVLGFLGIVVLLLSFHLTLERRIVIRQTLNLLGIALLFASVFFFFRNDTERYNWGTFEESVPLFTLIFASFIAFCFLGGTFWNPQQDRRSKTRFLSKV